MHKDNVNPRIMQYMTGGKSGGRVKESISKNKRALKRLSLTFRGPLVTGDVVSRFWHRGLQEPMATGARWIRRHFRLKESCLPI